MSNKNKSEYIWHNGELIPWGEARVHVLTHALHYGSSVFEGIRLYDTPDAPSFFRLDDHMRRLYDSAKVYRMALPYDLATLTGACHSVVARNNLHSGAYIRPLAFLGECGLGVCPPPDAPVDVTIAAIEWGAYLGAEGLEKGVDVCISSWNRVAPNTIPAMAKAGGNYLSGILISGEAKRHGYVEGIGLSVDGTVSEGAGENLFLVKDGIVYTPPNSASILGGITRHTLMTLARDLGYEVVEQNLPREALYLADELFFTGTAVEVTPVRSVDGIEVGNGSRGAITEKLQDAFFGLFRGTTEDKWGWLEPLQDDQARQAATGG